MLAARETALAATFTTIDVPGAIETFSVSINTAGAITGSYFDAYGWSHGFVRSSSGAFTSFDIPGTSGPQGPSPISINTAGAITGIYYSASFEWHGFVRSSSGALTTFGVPGARETYPASINTAGAITGSYFDANFGIHGFVRSASGTLTTFDFPGAISTSPRSINTAGTITGSYLDATTAQHGFVRSSDGAFTKFDVPGATGTAPESINTAGAITGGGFVRSSDGAFTKFDVPGAPATVPAGINTAGAITGLYQDANFVFHGFVRDSGGIVTTFDVPDARTGSPPYGAITIPRSINDAGAITGHYYDAYGLLHGFVRNPDPLLVNIVFSAKSGPVNARVWTITITNTSAGTAAGSRINSLGLIQMAGAACTPSILAPALPLTLGDIAPGGSATGDITLNFTGCPASARFTAVIAYSANNHDETTKILYNQFQ